MNRRSVALVLSLASWALFLACEPGRRPAARDEDGEPRPPVVATAAVDRALATTGDVVTYSITVDREPDIEVELPDPGSVIAGFRIIDLGQDEPQTVQGRVVERRWYELRADLVGSYVLPPVTLTFKRLSDKGETETEAETLETSEIFVEVQSVLPEDGEVTDIRDIKPLRPLDKRLPWLSVGGAAAAVVALLMVAGFLHRRRRPRILPPIPPHEAAFKALDSLRSTDFSDPRAVRRFYFAVSEVTRAYVEGRFGLSATDLTTEEIAARLPRVTELGADDATELKAFLVDTDQVKFAGHQPQPQEIESTYERALSFVERTRPQEEAA
jgi:hypothetical protein